MIVFGRGGLDADIAEERALALPPLDLTLADDLIDRSRMSRILSATRTAPAARRDAVALTLVRLSQMAADVPEIGELRLDPLVVDAQGIVVVDAKVAIVAAPAASESSRYAHMSVRPYPKEWQRVLNLRGKQYLARPVRPEDEPLFLRFFERVTDADMRLRFFAPVKDFSHAFIARLTQIDYGRAMAFVVLEQPSGDLAGVVRLHADPDYETGEYAILLRSDLKGQGLGWAMMELLIEYARKEGLQRMHGQVLRENSVMVEMCRALGFDIQREVDDDSLYLVTLDLAPGTTTGPGRPDPR